MPFEQFSPGLRKGTPLRAAISAAHRRPERACLTTLVDAATLPEEMRAAIASTAGQLVTALRRKGRCSGIDRLMQEYALSSREGVALMCLAEALLRIPDSQTRDALIRDKISKGNWDAHLAADKGLFVNAATWGLIVTRTLTRGSESGEVGLSPALTGLVARAGEPVIRKGVSVAMRLLGEQFVLGQSIEEALKRSHTAEKRGYSHSFDMLGEAAATQADALAYLDAYRSAIHAIGKAAGGRGPYAGPGVSVKLSALHPRYTRSQADRVMGELLPRMRELTVLARSYDIGLNIDAEEADRLELSLDVFESLALDPGLAGWNGLGFVVQAYGKRCPYVIDWIIDLAYRADRRIMVRLVKGAYWDTEIKRAQIDGLPDFPVYTRKLHTDVAYLACARRLLGAPAAVYPQFATHNAQSLAAIYHLAGPGFSEGDYEFQCLHGMGLPLYDEVVGPANLDRPCRIYAPVGSHETLLAYLVRRLLENGANSSFVNRIADREIPVEELVADPVSLLAVATNPGPQLSKIRLPGRLFSDRRNSLGLDINDDAVLADLQAHFRKDAGHTWTVASPRCSGALRTILNPGDHTDIVGQVREACPADTEAALLQASRSDWATTPVEARAGCLERAAEALESDYPRLIGLLMREAGKTLPNAVAEVREAVDFLRYYAQQARQTLIGGNALGPVVCISPWNFPLAIFIGQVAAALVAGNPVLAKPAEETPLIAAQAVRFLHTAGVPEDALQFLPGEGQVGAALAGSRLVQGVMFTGSTEVARLIQSQLAARISRHGTSIPLIAETGGQNAMIVDSSALPEQVVSDVIISAFDSAGQRCSALRLLCLHEDIYDRILTMLKGAMAELRIGPADRLSTDIGPVISETARAAIEAHVSALVSAGHGAYRRDLPEEAARGTFVTPTLIEIDSAGQLGAEIFGPVLHVLRYCHGGLDQLIDDINATGYGLTFGLHTRIDTTADRVLGRIHAGNRYVNRNTIGAVVGVQPFGGHGLSGTGPKAGGPLYLSRLTANCPSPFAARQEQADPVLDAFILWLRSNGRMKAAEWASLYGSESPIGRETDLPGPVGENNRFSMQPRGTILLRPQTDSGLWQQVAAVLATGNRAVLSPHLIPADLPDSVRERLAEDPSGPIAGALLEGDREALLELQGGLAARPGNIVPIQSATPADCNERAAYRVDWLCNEVSTSINIAAAGGNADLMAISI